MLSPHIFLSHFQMLFCFLFLPALQNNAYHPAVVVVHNFLHSILAASSDTSSSIIEILPRMPFSISSPMDFPKILVSQAPSSLFFALSDVGDQIIRLLLASDDRRDLGLNIARIMWIEGRLRGCGRRIYFRA